LLAARHALAAGKPAEAIAFFEECLVLSDHPQALAGRVALAWANSDFSRLIALADRMSAVPAEDPWFHYLAGAAMLLAGHLNMAEISARHAASDPATAAEGRHLLALVRDRRNDAAGAADLLCDAAVGTGAAADHAVALRGQAAWRGGDYAEALRCWQRLPDARLKTWNLATMLGGTAFLAGLKALRDGNAADAANWLLQAARYGHVDPRLESLLTTACAQAGATGHGVELLEQAVDAGGPRPELIRHLARAYRRSGRRADARRALESASADDRSLTLERGLLAVAEGQLVAAEKSFAAVLQDDPDSAAATVNLLFTRLSLGRLAEAVSLMPRAAALAPTDELRATLTRLQKMASGPAEGFNEWTIEDVRAAIDCLRSLGRLESAAPLFANLQRMRSQSQAVQEADAELTPLRAMDRIERGDPAGARELLEKHAGQNPPALVRNLLGICACLYQDFGRGVRHFQAALPPVGDDARIQQNLALGRSWMNDRERGAAHWRRFLELQGKQTPKPPGVPDYHRRVADLVRERLKDADAVLISSRGG
jgi:tetratricopeptide (TPR) repeat protein